jgi:hypothetical protein
MAYNREKSVEYAHKWAFARNPFYYNFDSIGGDCTNFVSQCLYAGCGTMDYTPDTGWYYNSVNDRAAAWSGVEYLYKFLTGNKSKGIYARELPVKFAEKGDIIQLSFDGAVFEHSLFVTDIEKNRILIAAHTTDSDNRPLDSYEYKKARLLHISG